MSHFLAGEWTLKVNLPPPPKWHPTPHVCWGQPGWGQRVRDGGVNRWKLKIKLQGVPEGAGHPNFTSFALPVCIFQCHFQNGYEIGAGFDAKRLCTVQRKGDAPETGAGSDPSGVLEKHT